MDHSRNMLESRKKIDIPIKQIPNNQRGNIASQARAVCENEYATRYLESIGVLATKDHRDYMLSNLPIEVWGETCVGFTYSRLFIL
jgi:hypothetical protein